MSAPSTRAYRPIRIVSIELSARVPDVHGLDGYRELRAIVRMHGFPVGQVSLPVTGASCPGSRIVDAALFHLEWSLVRRLLDEHLEHGIDAWDPLVGFGARRAPASARKLPSITVAVCTRDRADDLALCLDALDALDPRPREILVVDNAPTDESTRAVVALYPKVRYVVEPRPGLDWARNRAIREASGEVVAFTDDDVIVDSQWAGAIAEAFADDDSVMAVTGLVLPAELETEAQELFERYGGFARGFERRWFRVPRGASAAALHGGTGKFGTGANMAFRRGLFDEIGGFDPALDVGTVTCGGGDLDMFYRVLRAGHTLAYDPAALAWHRHRRSYEKLRTQIAANGLGFYAYLVRNALHDRKERGPIMRLGVWWFGYWNLRRLALSYLKPGKLPRDLIFAELAGSIRGVARYPKARRIAASKLTPDDRLMPRAPTRELGSDCMTDRVLTVDIGRGVAGPPLPRERAAKLVVLNSARLFGMVETGWADAPVRSARQIRAAIVNTMGTTVLRRHRCEPSGVAWTRAVESLHASVGASVFSGTPTLNSDMSVSVVIPTYDRAEALARCLESVTTQRTTRRVEVIVVDNHPSSGLTAPVVARFPGVRLIVEQRAGLSYARNAGISAAASDIIIATDDDVTMPADWLERLVTPFVDAEVMAVTGNVLPADLSGDSQKLFEAYGGLSRGMTPYRVDRDWFWSFRTAVPTWWLGATANAAFRSEIFRDAEIGLLDEALGAGTPTGCSEDTDLFYRVLRAGYAIAYEPEAFVWHHHRTDIGALRRQIYAYAKGHVAYQLTTLKRDGDLRALVRLLFELPRVYFSRVRERLSRRSPYPLSFIALEILGTLAGPFALWRSRARAARLGRSEVVRPCATSGKSACSSSLGSTSCGDTGVRAGDIRQATIAVSTSTSAPSRQVEVSRTSGACGA